MENNIKDALLEVRKAYRLLFDYQSRILDLISFIERKIEYNFYGGWPMYSDSSPKAGKGSLDSWAWAWLNLYYYAFDFTALKKEDNVFNFAIFHLSDSGYFEKEGLENGDKIYLNKYKEVTESSSKLIFVIGFNMWCHDGTLWSDRAFTNEIEGIKKDEEGGKIIWKSYDLEKFISEESTNVVLEDFKQYCNKYDIPFELTISNIIS